MNTRVRIYQDVDGVINAHMPYGWGRLSNGAAGPPGAQFRIRWAPHMVEALDALDADRVWTTTWCDAAEDHIRPLVGLSPAQRVLMPLSGQVTFPSVDWKIESIVEDQLTNPGPFIWLDDEAWDPFILDPELVPGKIASDLGGYVPMIDPRLGITPKHMEEMQAYIDKNK